MKNKKIYRICPQCKQKIYHTTVSNRNSAERLNRVCKKCGIEKLKGKLPWNKGISTPIEVRLKISISKKGQIPWNKGLHNHLSNEQINRLRDSHKNQKSPFKNKKIDEIYGKEKAQIIREKISKTGINRTPWNKGKKTPDDTRKKQRLSAIKRIENSKGQVIPNYNPNSIIILEQKAKELGITDLQHAENGGEYYIKELGYWVDGYSPSKNIVIEYYETMHNNKKERDERRKQEIINFLKCEFIEIKQ